MTLEELLAAIKGSAGKAIDTVGRATGNIAPELNISENLEAQGAVAVPTEERVTRVQEDPRFGTDLATSSNQYYPNVSQVPDQPSYVAPSSSRLDELRALEAKGDLNPAQKTELENMTDGDKGGGDTNAFAKMVELARGAYDEAVRRANAQFGVAQGIFDEGTKLLGQRRGEFKDLWNEGEDKILGTYEGERGNLQASAQGASQRAANALRAMGITGGSGAINYEGRQRQQNAKQLGNLQTQRNENTKENQRQYDERLTWARGQESALKRALDAANEQRTATINQAGLVNQGDVNQINQNASNYLNNILAHQQALSAAKGGIGSYEANPYAVNMSDFTNSITAALPSVNGTGSAANQGVNIDDDLATLAELKKRLGVSGAGLYA